MRVAIIRAYTTICKLAGLTPTFEGLKVFNEMHKEKAARQSG